MAVVYVINKMEVDMTNSHLNITNYKVMQSNAGWYVGRGCFPCPSMPDLEQPYDRQSEYFSSASEAQEWLEWFEWYSNPNWFEESQGSRGPSFDELAEEAL